MLRQPDPIPDTIRSLFDHLMAYASTGDLGVISVLDKRTHETRFALVGQHFFPDGRFTLVPLGFLSNTAGDEVTPPGAALEVAEFEVRPECYEHFRAYGSDDQADIDRWADDGGCCHEA
jgi:hypothetical protein